MEFKIGDKVRICVSALVDKTYSLENMLLEKI